jgi:hypothetical protein
MKRIRERMFRALAEQPVYVLILLVLLAPILSAVAVLGYQDLQVISAPGNPASGYLRFFATTGALNCLTSSGGNCLAGIGSPLTTKGDIYTFGSANARLAVGTNTYCLTANSSAANGIDWEACGAGSVTSVTIAGTSGQIAVSGTCTITSTGTCTIGLPSGGTTVPTSTTSPAFIGSGSDPYITLPSNTGHSFSSGDLVNVSGVLNFNNGVATVTLVQNPMTTKGDVIVGATSGVPARLAVGTNTYCLTANSAATNGVDWEACATPASPGQGFGASFGSVASGASALVVDTAYFTVPKACTINAWNINVNAGTATFDVWKVATGTAIPTVTNSITASAQPAISTGTSLHSTSMSGWTTSVAANDIVAVNLKTVATATYASLVVECD